MTQDIAFYSYGVAFLTFSLLGVLIFFNREHQRLATELLLATVASALWALTTTASTLSIYPLVIQMQVAELVRDLSWCFVLLKFVGLRLQDTDHAMAGKQWIAWFCIGGFAILLAVLFAPQIVQTSLLSVSLARDTSFIIWLAISVLGLLLLEQIYRNSGEGERWLIKYLCIGLGLIFAYDFFMYAEALLFRQLDQTAWRARGFVNALSSLFVAFSIVRSSRQLGQQNLYLSRHVVFHSVTLLAAGIYLISMALAGYFLRYLGGSWGGVAQIAFLTAAGLLLLALLFSGQIRSRLRLWLSKNFFSYKYDYRVEWLKFTRTLAQSESNVPEAVVQAMANLTKSPGGMLWSRDSSDKFQFDCTWELAEPDALVDLGKLSSWLEEHEWIIDLDEWRDSPDIYQDLEVPEGMLTVREAWLIIPLLLGEKLQGVVLLKKSGLQPEINWEDRDLLKVAGRQAASHLAQHRANQALVEARQFEAFNRLSAYVIHDLKNILAQQALIVSNAERHRDKPEFVDDVINTVRNSVARMTRLMEQMRSGERGTLQQKSDLVSILSQVVAERGESTPVPELSCSINNSSLVGADPAILKTVFAHLVQNAQEACDSTGEIKIRLSECVEHAVVEIEDDGAGMDKAFITSRLFKPFDSTKGLTGMGIGAFESREYVRKLGGDIQVTSSPGKGSTFRVSIPLSSDRMASPDEDLIRG